ncbi:uncharacterized protein Z520_07714 [Fonsecaea multimorphosa CBS 102226]|uniref:Asl1-like glycosyl hydrolase catalytic domain-containing protein n=1 Tax=Fonsecaea multimorphosa CBS 102226 TaxID=1442371 RepID=A0A0D2KIL4_9EURO|nr:uncharacterized protein Z520_07714 [Fonsecaea multimorphosa CBS 102226]KIX96448.1 hypothetical protein Z520_07714 [Fonsecaea multimorphosa CBS 102226]OAL22358.1 hypothetical protein AYO22_07402 [Fonsecaea multimorphosa]
MRPSNQLATISALLVSLLTTSHASSTNSTTPKRGLCYIATSHSSSDSYIFTTPRSPLTWYYNYSPWPGPSPSLEQWSTEFVPMVHSASDAAASVDTIKAVLNDSAGIPISGRGGGGGRNRIAHVLTFNEPDGDTSSGGTDSTPQTAAQVYIDTILPLRSAPWNLQISLPATTGSPRGLEWLRSFNASCFKLRPQGGCEADFLAAHWYGDFPGLTSWLGTLHGLYPATPIWVTEFAIPSAPAATTESFLTQSLPYLDGSRYVARYAWFGAFRSSGGDANEWTGDAVSLLDGKGKLTDLGAEYLGGEEDGFHQGESASSGAAGKGMPRSMMLTMMMCLVLTCTFATTVGSVALI